MTEQKKPSRSIVTDTSNQPIIIRWVYDPDEIEYGYTITITRSANGN